MLYLKRRNRFRNGGLYRRDRNRCFRPLRFESLEDRRLLAIVPDLTFIETEVDDTNGVNGLEGLFDIVVSPDGKHVYTAATFDDALAAFSRDSATGELTFIEALFDNTGGINGLDAVRSVAISPDGKHVYTAALLDSAVATFSRNATTGKLTFVEVDLDIGALVGLSGASGVTVSPDGKHVYVAARTDDALSAYERDATTGALTFIESEFDGIAGVNGLLDAERLTVSPDGKHVYVAAEGDNAVSVFSRDAMTGEVTFVEAQVDGVGGVDGLQAATSVAVSPDGAHVYVSSGLNLSPLDEDWLATFSRNATTGALTFINHISSTDPLPCTPDASVFSDTVVTVSIDGKIVYATKGGALVQFSRNTSTGELTVADAVCTSFDSGGLFAELLNPTDVAISPDGQQAYVGDLVGFLSAFHTQSRVFVVDSTGDGADANLADDICADAAGDCTLRAAIQQANATPNLVGRTDQIQFDVPGAGPHTITPAIALPTITEPVIIDGTSEPDFVAGGPPVVQLVGTSAARCVNGLKITAGGSTVRGLVINRFSSAGIRLQTGGSNIVAGNYIGTDVTGAVDLGNALTGVVIEADSTSNIIGGTTAAARNVISGNNAYGVRIAGSGSTGNQVQGNYIGTNAAGTADLGNTLSGVQIDTGANSNTIGGTTVEARNIISGNNEHGVSLLNAGVTANLVQGNYIGTNAAGTGALGNSRSGVAISNAPSNTIGGTVAGAGNLISGNSQRGVYVSAAGSTGNLVQGNYIGTDAAGTADLGNTLSGVQIDGGANSNTIGGTTVAARNIISGNNVHGVYLLGAGVTGNLVQGNYIGTAVNGTLAVGNRLHGVRVANAPSNTIGGTAAGAGNVISGNSRSGVYLTKAGTTGNLVQGNNIGTDAAGTTDLGNALSGVHVDGGASSNTIGGTTVAARNIISGNNQHGVFLLGAGVTGNLVRGNYIGTNAAGSGALGNSLSGIVVSNAPSNTIGGTVAGARNVISGNSQRGVYLSGAGSTANQVQGNYIGTNAAGTADLGNALSGVQIDGGASSNPIGGTATAARNIISGNNEHGVYLLGPSVTGNLVQGNYIGTAVNGTTALGNTVAGVRAAGAPSNTIGGTVAGARNVISGNGRIGVYLANAGTTGNLVQGNYIGTDAAGTVDVGNAFSGVLVDGGASSNTIGGTSVAARNIISGNNQHGVYLLGNGVTGNQVRGNYIGTAVNGTSALGNTLYGIRVADAPSNTIGGTAAGAGNVISGNAQSGVSLSLAGTTGTLVQGNLIGTDATGTADLGNTRSGVLIDGGANSNVIGGTTAATRNIISGNDRHGVYLLGAGVTGNLVQGNYIGTNTAGSGALGNSWSGVVVANAPSNTIGGTATGAGNVISGNSQRGVYLTGVGTPGRTTGNLVQGNRIGTDVTGTADLGNALSGVQIDNRASSNTIGGTTVAARNVISGNDQFGVLLRPGVTGNVVQGNYIGTAVNGTSALGNTQAGVQVDRASSNSVGGTASGAGNTISANGQAGVRIMGASTGNAVLRNSIFTNTGLGIDLHGNGVTANDVDDPDTGPNQLQNFPVITSALLSGANLNITYSVPSIAPNSTFPLRVEFFIADGANQEGQTFLASTSYTTPGSTTATIPAGSAASGTKIVATATDAADNTSEFSDNATVASLLLAAGGSRESSVESPALELTQLRPIIDAAFARFAAAGLAAQQLALLSQVQFSIADLPDATLGLATPNAITLDVNAAGYGWFIDPTPLDDSEFTPGSRLSSIDSRLRMDLLSAVMHELGHELGRDDLDPASHADDLMAATLAPGTRHTGFAHAADAILGSGGWTN